MKTASSSIELNYGLNYMGAKDVLSRLEEDESIAQNNESWFNPLPELMDGSYTLYKTLFQFYHKFKFGPHQSARVIQNRIPKRIWNSYLKFTVERNPFDKMVSMYFMNWGKDGIHRDGFTFTDWVKRNKNFPYNYPLYTWNDEVIVDRVLRYESLDVELQALYKELGIPFKGLDTHAKASHRKVKDYHEIHNPYTKKRTEEVFAKELALHHYTY